MKLNFYTRRREWNIVLMVVAVIIIGVSLLYTNNIVKRIAKQENDQINMWAQAVQQHAKVMQYSDRYFNGVRTQERLRMELLATAYQSFTSISFNENPDIYRKIIINNISIPIIIVDDNHQIIFSSNLPPNLQNKKTFDDEIQKRFSKYTPIQIKIDQNTNQWLYYCESLIYTELTHVLEDLSTLFLNDVTKNAVGAPVIIMNESQTQILDYGNLDSSKMTNSDYIEYQLSVMRNEHDPIQVDFFGLGKAYIYYRSSDLLLQLRYYPILQLLVIIIFLLVAYRFFSYLRNSEQNQVWAGMAKETAHQIGTPLSSLMGWVELLKMQEQPFEGTTEMEKDLERLQIITDRFSKIGSIPQLTPTNINPVINETMDYLRKRFSTKFEFIIKVPDHDVVLPLNAPLFSWVLENLTKNAVDAMCDKGSITVELKEENDRVNIDVSDTGRGIHKSAFKQVFNPGVTSKKRGWGLGLSLAKRIIEEYHKGKIFVKSSALGRGTTFRITLKK